MFLQVGFANSFNVFTLSLWLQWRTCDAEPLRAPITDDVSVWSKRHFNCEQHCRRHADRHDEFRTCYSAGSCLHFLRNIAACGMAARYRSRKASVVHLYVALSQVVIDALGGGLIFSVGSAGGCKAEI